MLKQWLIDYCDDVINDRVISCQKHKWACMRFLRDVEREGTKEFPYVFLEEKAIHFLEWMRLFKHTKGILAGQPIEPHEIQVFIFSNVYGWYHMEKHNRRFKKALWQVARKNAKSQSLAVVGSYEAAAFGEPMAEVYCAATKSDQAKIVWNEIKAQIMGSDFVRQKFKIANGTITSKKHQGFIKALSKDEGQTGDGKNVQCGLVDEWHLHKTSEIYDVLVSGSGARPSPIMWIITTAGFELNNPAYRVDYKLVSEILDPNHPTFNEEYFVMINEMDEGDPIDNVDLYEKANPILASYQEGRDFLASELKMALDAPDKMRNFLTKNLNKWVNMREKGYMDMEKWAKCQEDFSFEKFRGMECTIGLDLSAKIDLTSIAFEFKIDDIYWILGHSFMPENTLQAKMRSDNLPYDLYEQQGFLTLTEGDVVDYRYIQAYIQKIEKEYGIIPKEICADPWNASQFMQEMTDEGYTVIEIRQGMKTLAGPTKDFREQAYMGNVKHNGNPLITIAAGNAVTRFDSNENFMLDKSKSTRRIDPIACVMNAHVRAMLNVDTKSVYEERGLTIL